MYAKLLMGCLGALLSAPSWAAPCETVPVARQVEIAATVKESVQTYFAHWTADRAAAFETAFKAYAGAVSPQRCRRAFSLDTMQLMATLGNGHTKFEDSQLWAQSPGPVGLAVDYRQQRWIVANSRWPAISPGQDIVTLDGEPLEAVYQRLKGYIAASSERARRDKLFNMAILLPARFEVGFADGTRVRLDRTTKPGFWREPAAPSLPDGVKLHAIWGFDDPRLEEKAVAFVTAQADARAVVLDLRGNGGGSTPSRLMAALINTPYDSWGELSAMSVGLLKTYGDMHDPATASSDPAFAGMTEAMQAYFARPMLYAPGARVIPKAPVYTGPLYVLVDRHCASACEDIVYALKASGRATIVGETTYGSSGQPKAVDLGQEMTLWVGAKRMVFADGSPFEGIGIVPDVVVEPTAADVAEARDPALEWVVTRDQAR